MRCPKCGNENSPDAKYCRGCGNKMDREEQIAMGRVVDCPECGQTLDAGKRFCPKCGAPLMADASILTASVLAIPTPAPPGGQTG
jgi:uncharacterized membrane protein YvbJ